MINGENFFDRPVKDNKVTYENIRKIATGKGDDYTTGCLLDYPYFKDSYKMIGLDLSKQKALDADPRANQQINFTANLDRARNIRIYFILKEAKNTKLHFSQGTVTVLQICCRIIFSLIQNDSSNSLNVKLSYSQLNKLKSAIKSETDVILR